MPRALTFPDSILQRGIFCRIWVILLIYPVIMKRHYLGCPFISVNHRWDNGASGFTSATHHNYPCTALIQHVCLQSQPHTEAPIKWGILQIKKYWFDWDLNGGGFPHSPCLIPLPFWKPNMPLQIRWNEGNQLSLGFWKTKKSLISSLDNQALWLWIKKRAVVSAFDN